MHIDVLAGILLVAVFVLGTTTRANIGILGLLAAFALGGFAMGESTTEVLSGFPASLFLLILGVTYLFSVANSNGTMEWVIGVAARAVRGRAVAVPLGLFAGAVVITAFGAPAQVAVVMLAPVGIRLGRSCGISPFIAGLMVILGVGGGSFSPLNILAAIANQSMRDNGLAPQPAALFAGVLGANLALAASVIVFGAVRARRLATQPVSATVGSASGDDPSSGEGDEPECSNGTDLPPRRPIDLTVATTLAGFLFVLLGSVALELDLGALALAVALLLHLLFPRPHAMEGINWNVLLLICGLVTFIAVMTRAGTFDRVAEGLAGVGSPVVAALLICFGAALVSAFASSTATIGTGVVLAVPLLSDGTLGAVGLVIAICLSSTLVDASPFSSVGALTVAASPKRSAPRLFRSLLIWGFSMIVVAPVSSVLVFVAW
ncbi:SLC13 family permease [Pseudonocardia sp. ICBG1293]|uniref:SLC13 family permease n=1 Tax=Pseudonocardia sp. ICBG1293 TaxID=2844382 RepID=UPI001CCD73E9|nr:SLC13 family permease [Pseudonocardia sp. ICBG1293]